MRSKARTRYWCLTIHSSRIAVYGENHWYWTKDECAVLGGPSNDPSFNDSVTTNFASPYDTQTSYQCKVEYNCLMQREYLGLRYTPGPYPLEELKELNNKLDNKDQTLKITQNKKALTLKAKALKKSAKTIKALTVKGAKTKLSYKLSSVKKAKFKKFFKVNSSNGKITVKKGLKKGTYTLNIKVSAAGSDSYNPASKKVTLKIKVK